MRSIVSAIANRDDLKTLHARTILSYKNSRRPEVNGGGRVVRWCWVNSQCRDVLLIWIIVGQGLTVLAVGGVVWTFFLSSIISLFFLPLSGRRPDID